MTRFRVLTAGALVVGLLAGGVAFAQDGGPGRPAGRGGRGGPGGPDGVGLPLAQLNLTDSQRQQIRDLTQKRLEAGAQARERLQAAQQARRAAMETVPVNVGAIRSTTADLVAAETEVAILQAQLRAEVIGLLTPEQQDQLKTFQAQRAERAGARANRLNNRLERKR